MLSNCIDRVSRQKMRKYIKKINTGNNSTYCEPLSEEWHGDIYIYNVHTYIYIYIYIYIYKITLCVMDHL